MIEIGQVLEPGKPTRFEVRKVVYRSGQCERSLLCTATTMQAAEKMAERARADERAAYYRPGIFGGSGIWRF